MNLHDTGILIFGMVCGANAAICGLFIAMWPEIKERILK